jgi:hypothetical protein
MSVIIRNLDVSTEVLDEKYDRETLIKDIIQYAKFEHDKAKSQLINHIQIDNPGSSSMTEIVLERIKELQHFYKSINKKIDQLLEEISTHIEQFKIELPEVVQTMMLKAFMIHCIKHAEPLNPLWFNHNNSYFIKKCDTIIYVSPRYHWAASEGFVLATYEFDQPQEDGSTKKVTCNEHSAAMKAARGDRKGGQECGLRICN